MQTAYNQLRADEAAQPGNVSLLQNDLDAYYSVQEGVRAYAGEAITVVNGSDFNGQVADSNLEKAFGDSSFGQNEITVAVQLAETDWNQITNGSDNYSGSPIYVPTILDDDQEHISVFQVGGPGNSNILSYWSGTAPASENVGWMSSPFAYEMQGSSAQSQMFASLSSSQQAQAVANLEVSGFDGILYSNLNSTNVSEMASDLGIFAQTLIGYALQPYANLAAFGMSLVVTPAKGDTLTTNAATLDSAEKSSNLSSISNETLSFTSASNATQTINGVNGTSTVRLLNTGSTTTLTTTMYSGANGSGSVLESATLSSAGAVNANVYGNNLSQDISGATVNLGAANLSYVAAGTGFVLNGKSTDTAWLGNGAQGSLNGLGTIGLGHNDTINASNTSLVFETNSSATVSGSGLTGAFWGNNGSFTGFNASLTCAGSLTGIVASGNGNKISLGANDTLTAGGTGVTVTGQSSDTVWGGTGASLNVSGVGTVGIGSGNTLTTSNAALVFENASSATVTGSGNSAQFWGNNATFNGSNSTASVAANLTGITVNGQSDKLTVGANATAVIAGTSNVVAEQTSSTLWLANNARATVTGGGTVGIGTGDTLTANSTSIVLGTGSTLTLNGSSNSITAWGNNASITGSGNLVTMAQGITGATVTGGNNILTLGAGVHVTINATNAQLQTNGYYQNSNDVVTFNNTTSGSSQVQNWTSSGNVSNSISDYAGLNGAGSLQDITKNLTNGTSASTWYNPGNGVSQVSETFTGYNDTGVVTSASVSQSGGNVYDYSYIYDGDSLEDQWQQVFNSSGMEVGDAEFNADGGVVDDVSGNYSDGYTVQMIVSYGDVSYDDGDGDDGDARPAFPTAHDIFNIVGTSSGQSITLESSAQTVNANGYALQISASAADAGAQITGAAGAVLTITQGGTATLNSKDSGLIVQLSQSGTLFLGTGSFIRAIGSSGSDTLVAGGANQTLTGGDGNDTLIGADSFGDVFRDTTAGLNGDTILNFGGSDVIDISDLLWSPSLSDSVVEQNGKDVVTLSNGTAVTSFDLGGKFTIGSLSFASDGQGGTQITLHH